MGEVANELGGGNIIPVGDRNVRQVALNFGEPCINLLKLSVSYSHCILTGKVHFQWVQELHLLMRCTQLLSLMIWMSTPVTLVPSRSGVVNSLNGLPGWSLIRVSS